METIESQEAAKAPEQHNLPSNLIVAATGQPFKTDTAARASMTKLKLHAGTHRIVVAGDGYAIQKPEADQDIPIAKHIETYWRVKFNAKSHVNESDDVMLSVNGEVLIMKREQEVILPERFLVCADNATYPHFQQLPNKPRKVIGHIKTFPYTRLGEATKREYETQRNAGTKKSKADVARYGFDLDPEEIAHGQ